MSAFPLRMALRELRAGWNHVSYFIICIALGSTRGMITRTFAVEYAVTGASAGILGTALSVGLSWSVLRFMMEIPWTFHPITLLFGVAVTVGLTTAIGFLSTFQVLGQKPLPILREE